MNVTNEEKRLIFKGRVTNKWVALNYLESIIRVTDNCVKDVMSVYYENKNFNIRVIRMNIGII